MVCCLPGARVRDVSDRVHDILVRKGKQPEVVIHVGTNDIGRKGDEVLKCEFRELGRRLKNRSSRVAFSGLLPVLRDSDELLHGQISAGGSQQSQGLRQLSGLLTCCKIIHCSRFEGATSNQLLDEIVSFVKTTFDKLVQDSDTHFHPIAHPSSSSPTPTLCPPSHTPTVSPPHPLPPALPPQCL
ncbi:uncharacterized protein [Mobula birostris]|uniref:uncharacterized protein isoform X2 n=1 Tax=Mobula birostris TaxID=1983395 RepID=UPI003B282E7F